MPDVWQCAQHSHARLTSEDNTHNRSRGQKDTSLKTTIKRSANIVSHKYLMCVMRLPCISILESWSTCTLKCIFNTIWPTWHIHLCEYIIYHNMSSCRWKTPHIRQFFGLQDSKWNGENNSITVKNKTLKCKCTFWAMHIIMNARRSNRNLKSLDRSTEAE